ncbi:hypothetical protein MA16_Dca019669 [Dendrobium catenatum]|uniref:Uncharacterized protein n=1 Tax=Dendrobium catenatum TaxID=906689 RepID=A0A2I0X193_9ASPA|nr:hypothetical protein MA16_Dca019669 [Dendrobium catenatum]
MATEGRRPQISGGLVDVHHTSISMSHGPAWSFSSSPPAFGSAFTSKETVFQNAAENQIDADGMMVQAMDESRMKFLDIIATEGNDVHWPSVSSSSKSQPTIGNNIQGIDGNVHLDADGNMELMM